MKKITLAMILALTVYITVFAKSHETYVSNEVVDERIEIIDNYYNTPQLLDQNVSDAKLILGVVLCSTLV